jgi:hypothetical protein
MTKAVGMAITWNTGSYRHMQITELISMKEVDQPLTDFPAANEVREFLPNRMTE